MFCALHLVSSSSSIIINSIQTKWKYHHIQKMALSFIRPRPHTTNHIYTHASMYQKPSEQSYLSVFGFIEVHTYLRRTAHTRIHKLSLVCCIPYWSVWHTVNCNVYFVGCGSKKGLIYNQHINNNSSSRASGSGGSSCRSKTFSNINNWRQKQHQQ